ncbi:hypothetical protein NDU88_007388 [Pleurodeles waltl]|uniref:Reverse transcriptase domain-containing protein n=1 Tax=Pleurodeles waltl TaxID=8319 RepID=A0AAV7UQV7_PLEWA|nr:hypothetical protein NDU88_007388 [Pleurodeles waltl]
MSEFLQACSATIVEKLQEVFLEAQRIGTLTPTMRKGIICLMLKPGGSPDDPSSYRPLSMINSDVKVLCRLLVSRLQMVVRGLVHEDQCRFMPARSQAHNLRHLAHILHKTTDREQDLALVSIDKEIAFNTVSLGYLMVVLWGMGPGPVFWGWVQLLYTNHMALILVGCEVSEA